MRFTVEQMCGRGHFGKGRRGPDEMKMVLGRRLDIAQTASKCLLIKPSREKTHYVVFITKHCTFLKLGL